MSDNQIGAWEVEDFQDSDFGNEPEWSMEDLQGRCVIVRGLSEGTFKSEKYPGKGARSILHNMPEENPDTPPWGLFSAVEGVPIDKLSKVTKFPVAVRFWKRQGAKFVYWDMEKYQPAYDSNGRRLPPNDDAVVEAFLRDKKAVT